MKRSKKLKHTPGPWLEDGEGDESVITDANGKVIAHVHATAKNFPNLMLMVAAPDMLEALEDARILLMVLDEHVAKENESVLKSVQAAIRKAKGE